MKCKLFIAFLIVVLLVCLVGCGKNKNPSGLWSGKGEDPEIAIAILTMLTLWAISKFKRRTVFLLLFPLVMLACDEKETTLWTG